MVNASHVEAGVAKENVGATVGVEMDFTGARHDTAVNVPANVKNLDGISSVFDGGENNLARVIIDSHPCNEFDHDAVIGGIIHGEELSLRVDAPEIPGLLHPRNVLSKALTVRQLPHSRGPVF